jgi:ABC-2 type transport system ATP-binding protein
MIEVRNLTKDYGSVVAVRDVSFDVGKGEIVGFLGPNGAGKTTTLRILAGFLGATSGSVRIAGFDVARDSLKARARLGYMPEAAPLYPELRVREYLAFRAALKRVPRRERKAAVARSLEQAAVTDVAETPIGQLSKGYRQRVALADALVSNPPLLILDEPTAGLDPNQIIEVRKLVRELGKSHTILLSTHILPEVEAVCDRALVIARGRLVAGGSLGELKASQKSRESRLVVRGAPELLKDTAASVAGVASARTAPSSEGNDLVELRLELAGDADPEATVERAVAALVAAGAGVRSVGPVRASLEEVFAELTQREAEKAPAATAPNGKRAGTKRSNGDET